MCVAPHKILNTIYSIMCIMHVCAYTCVYVCLCRYLLFAYFCAWDSKTKETKILNPKQWIISVSTKKSNCARALKTEQTINSLVKGLNPIYFSFLKLSHRHNSKELITSAGKCIPNTPCLPICKQFRNALHQETTRLQSETIHRCIHKSENILFCSPIIA